MARSVDERAAAVLSYLPVPGFAALTARLAPESRLARFHAWQGGLLVVLLYAGLILLGLLARVATGAARTALGFLAGLLLLLGVAALVVGAVAAGRGAFVRLRPVWDVLAR